MVLGSELRHVPELDYRWVCRPSQCQRHPEFAVSGDDCKYLGSRSVEDLVIGRRHQTEVRHVERL
jgi:hypothetical protein